MDNVYVFYQHFLGITECVHVDPQLTSLFFLNSVLASFLMYNCSSGVLEGTVALHVWDTLMMLLYAESTCLRSSHEHMLSQQRKAVLARVQLVLC